MKKLFQFLLGCGLVMLASISYGQSLTLTSPNGGEVWEGTSTHTISWNYSNVDYIKIEYSLDNGLSWNTISASYASSALTYAWTVPAIASTQAKVRITNTLQYTQDESNGVFTIPPPTISLVYPNGGEQYKAGSGQYVEWVSTGLASVNLHYSLDNGANWTSIGTFPATNGYANWVVPNSLSNQLLLRASNSENALLNDVSNAVTAVIAVPTVNPTKYYGGPYDGYDMSSTLPDAITVTAPNGAEVLYPYATYNITWDYQDVNLVNIFYSTNNGQNWTNIASNIAASSKSYAWSVANAPSTNCLIKVVGVDNPLVDISNAVFTISYSFVQVTYPNGGETFGIGTGQYIEWDFVGVATIKLEYSTDNGTTWTSIGTAPATNRYANWVTPTNAANCIIRISDDLVPALNDVSDVALSLNTIPTVNPTKYYGGPYDGYSMQNNRMDSVQVTSPNGAEIWMSASTQNITWTYNNVDYITIEYTINDGVTWNNIASNIPASQLTYAWTVPSTPSNICRVRIKDMYSNLVDISDEAFIIPNGFVQLLYPNGGESFGKGTGQYIEWNSDGLANIQLDYSIDNGTTWNVIGTFPGANKYANWVCPLTTSNQALVRISDPSGSGIYVDQSNLSFSVTGVPTVNPTKYYGGPYDGYSMYNYLDQYVKVIKPNGGEIWGNGTTQQIKWATLNNDENLKIEFTTDNEATWTTLLNDVPNTPVTFDWNIAATPSTTCKVRATTMSGLEVDKSDNFFTIANPNGIVTSAIAGNNFCPGQTFNVNFTKSTTFNAGNQFIVQLSDSVGTFNGSLVNIGSISSITPAPIAVTMPDRYYTSNQYRLRVIGTNPPTIGTDNGTNFTIKVLPLVNLGNDITLCAGNSQTLNATNTASTYLWSTGATTATLSVNQAGTYWVAVTNSCGVSRDTVVVNVLSPPVVNLGPDLQICQNAAVTLTADSGATSYQWSTGAITRSIQAVLAGNYVAYATNQCGTASDNINISYLTAPTIELGNDQGLCPGSQVVLNATASNSSYLWSNGATSPTLTVTQPGTYWVNVTTQCGVISDQISIYNGGFTLNAGADVQLCGGQPVTLQATGANNYTWSTGQTSSVIQVNPTQTTTYTVNATNIYNCTATDQVVVNVNPTPTAPVVSSSGSSTYCANETVTLSVPMDASLTYQWLRNSLTLSGATSNSFSPTSTANYQLRVTNLNNCSTTSSANYITVNPVIGSTTMAEGCTDYTWVLNGQNYTTSGTYVYNTPCHADTLVLHLTVGETCDDGDACTINDVFQTDCTCAGTFSDTDSDGTCDANDLCAGPEAGATCDDGDVCTLNDVIQDNCTCLGTFSDADNDGTCDANDVCQGEEPGATCDDGDTCMENDVIQDNCTCAGTFSDTDSDGTCDANDLCQGPEAGTACDDGDACTENDVIQGDCTCSGLLIDANNDGICDLNSILGCTDENACNYNPEANTDDGSCILSQPEICNSLDDNCDGVVDEGLVPSGLNITNVATMQYPVCVGTAIASANLNNGANSNVMDGDGNDLWFGLTAQYNTLRAGLSAATGNNALHLFKVNPAGCLELLETEHETTSGNQTLLTDQLTVGQTYYVSVHNISGPMNASAKICFNHLTGSICDHYYSNNTGIYTSVCNSFKAQYRANAVAYGFEVLSATQNNVDQAIAPWTYTTPNAISVVSRLGMILPANQGTSPMVYTLKVPVLYSLFDAAGNFENLFAQATSTCTVTLNAESTVALRSSDRCPTNKPITSNIAPDRTVCGAMRYDWEFTEVLPAAGTAQVVQGGAYASAFFLSNIPGVATGKTYNVRVRPVHTSGTTGNWGTAHCMRIGVAGMVMQSESENESDAGMESRVSGISIYPNPTATGSFVLQYNGSRRGELIFAQEPTNTETNSAQEPTTTESASAQELVMFDITGKVVYQKQVVLNGNPVEIKFGHLASGVYVVMVGEDRLRLIVE